MKFDTVLHRQCPKGFTAQNNDRSREEAPDIRTHFFAPEDLHFYGLNAEVTGVLGSDMEKRWLGPRVKKQEAYLILSFNPAWEGWEHEEGSRYFYGSAADGTNIGRTWTDPEKEQLIRVLKTQLQERLAALEVKAKFFGTNDHKIRFEFQNDRISPIQQIETLYVGLREISKACERGEKPLGDLPLPKGRMRINPALHPDKDYLPTDRRKLHDNWQGYVQQRAEKEIGILAKRCFRGGEKVTLEAHERFTRELSELLGQSRG